MAYYDNFDRQDVFNRVVAHLMKQGGPAFGSPEPWRDAMCLYRGPDGRACGFGGLIPDELYDPGIEGNVASDVNESIGLFDLPNDEAGRWLNSLQKRLHDRLPKATDEDFMEALPEAVGQFARRHGLTNPLGGDA